MKSKSIQKCLRFAKEMGVKISIVEGDLKNRI